MLFSKNGTTPMESTTGGINSLTVSKYYTGEPVTFTTDEIGVPTIGSGTPLENSVMKLHMQIIQMQVLQNCS